MIFSKKETTIAYTEEKCDSCKKSAKRRYREGDILFEKAHSCNCGGSFYIDKIYGETLRQ